MVFTMKHDAEEYVKNFGLTNAKIILDKDRFYKLVPKKLENVRLVKNWEELASLNLENENFKVEVKNNCCGWIRSKKENIYDEYLSTHTFYGLKYKISSLKFQLRGFMIEIGNWDKGEKFIEKNNLNKPTNFNDLLNLQDFYNKKIIQKKKEEISCYREPDIWDIRNCILDEFQEFKRELSYEYNFKTYRYKDHNPEKQLEEYVDILNFILCKIIIVKDNYSKEAWQDFTSEVLEKNKKTLEKMIINFEYYATQAEFFDFENRYVYPYMIDYYLKIGNFFNYTKEDIYNQYWKKFLENCKRENLYD